MDKIKKLLRENLLREVYNDKCSEILDSAINIVCTDLDIKRPDIEFISDSNYTKLNKSFAAYSPSEKKVYVVTHNRNTADIMRSIAHELMHLRQDLDGRLTFEAGNDGDDFENEANSYSGKIMRKIGREIPGIFESVNKMLVEDFDTNEEVTELANTLLKVMIKRSVTRLVYDGISLTNFPNIFQDLSPKFKKLNDFLRDYHLKISWNPGNEASHFASRNKTNGTIELNHSHDEFINSVYNVVNENFKDVDTTNITESDLKEAFSDVYFKVYSNKIISTLIHEIQHAYDSWRSNDKYRSDKTSKAYYKDGDIEMDEKRYNYYLKLHHEINARFSQTIAKTQIIDMILDQNNPTKPFGYQFAVPIREFMNNFIKNFVGYKQLNETQKKYIIRRASQYYHAAKEKYDGKIHGKS